MENEAFKTQVTRTSEGWRAVTEIALEGQRQLHITTERSLHDRRQLQSIASVCTARNEERLVDGRTVIFTVRTHNVGYGRVGDGDYYQRVIDTPCARMTEKAVRELHQEALKYWPLIHEQIERHYGVAALPAAA